MAMNDGSARKTKTTSELDEALTGLKDRLQSQDPLILESKLVNRAQLRQLYPASDMTIWRLQRRGQFPMPKRICGRNYWPFVEVIEAISRLASDETHHPATSEVKAVQE